MENIPLIFILQSKHGLPLAMPGGNLTAPQLYLYYLYTVIVSHGFSLVDFREKSLNFPCPYIKSFNIFVNAKM